MVEVEGSKTVVPPLPLNLPRFCSGRSDVCSLQLSSLLSSGFNKVSGADQSFISSAYAFAFLSTPLPNPQILAKAGKSHSCYLSL